MHKMTVLLLPLLLAGCLITTTKWDKAGATEESVARDKAECRLVAEREAVRRYGAPPAPSASSIYGQSSSAVPVVATDTERFNIETRLQTACMRSRGYDLVKVEEPKEPPPAAPPPAAEPPK